MQLQHQYRPARVAGMFYPAEPRQIARLLAEWSRNGPNPTGVGILKALIVPHAGYIYSGPVAHTAYQLLKNQAFTTVILIGPSHFDGFEGVTIYPGAGYTTPLGKIDIDHGIAHQLVEDNRFIEYSELGHGREHALEVQLPFLQHYLPGSFKILPLVIGDQSLRSSQRLAAALKPYLSHNMLLIASSDLSHYHEYTQAKELDLRFARALVTGDAVSLWEGLQLGRFEACGFGPILTILEATKHLGHQRRVQQLDLRNSGDTAGSRDQVVGYLAAAITQV